MYFKFRSIHSENLQEMFPWDNFIPSKEYLSWFVQGFIFKLNEVTIKCFSNIYALLILVPIYVMDFWMC